MIRTALACALLLAPTALHAQQQRFSTYATVDVTDWGVQENGNSDFKGDAAGFTAGAFYTFPVNSRRFFRWAEVPSRSLLATVL
jgi:hypothetical protein